MKLIDQLLVPRLRGGGEPAVIQLLEGDLAALPPEHAVDALVVSAFPSSYTANPGTLFASLRTRGLDMQIVAEHKIEDERNRLGCWLSDRLPPDFIEQFNFQRILCFEPQYPAFVQTSRVEGSIEESVAFVFRCLNNFIIPDKDKARDYGISRVAMPLLATGNQGVPVEALFPHLLDAAIFWLEQGLPISELKIVAFKPADAALAKRLFGQARLNYALRPATMTMVDHRADVPAAPDWESRLAQTISREVVRACQAHLRDSLLSAALDDERTVVERVLARAEADAATPATSSPSGDYDVFISYAHKQEHEVKDFVEELRKHISSDRIFFDRSAIPVGGQWIKILSNAVQKARTFVAVLSPDYTASRVCWDEFQCAKLKEYNTGQSVIKTVRLYKENDLPPIMGIYSYVDCAEGDVAKLRECAAEIAR